MRGSKGEPAKTKSKGKDEKTASEDPKSVTKEPASVRSLRVRSPRGIGTASPFADAAAHGLADNGPPSPTAGTAGPLVAAAATEGDRDGANNTGDQTTGGTNLEGALDTALTDQEIAWRLHQELNAGSPVFRTRSRRGINDLLPNEEKEKGKKEKRSSKKDKDSKEPGKKKGGRGRKAAAAETPDTQQQQQQDGSGPSHEHPSKGKDSKTPVLVATGAKPSGAPPAAVRVKVESKPNGTTANGTATTTTSSDVNVVDIEESEELKRDAAAEAEVKQPAARSPHPRGEHSGSRRGDRDTTRESAAAGGGSKAGSAKEKQRDKAKESAAAGPASQSQDNNKEPASPAAAKHHRKRKGRPEQSTDIGGAPPPAAAAAAATAAAPSKPLKPAKPIKIPKLPMVLQNKRWYRARLLKDTGEKVLLEFAGFESILPSIWLPRSSDRIWLGSYKGKDWRYLGEGAWEPKAHVKNPHLTGGGKGGRGGSGHHNNHHQHENEDDAAGPSCGSGSDGEPMVGGHRSRGDSEGPSSVNPPPAAPAGRSKPRKRSMEDRRQHQDEAAAALAGLGGGKDVDMAGRSLPEDEEDDEDADVDGGDHHHTDAVGHGMGSRVGRGGSKKARRDGGGGHGSGEERLGGRNGVGAPRGRRLDPIVRDALLREAGRAGGEHGEDDDEDEDYDMGDEMDEGAKEQEESEKEEGRYGGRYGAGHRNSHRQSDSPPGGRPGRKPGQRTNRRGYAAAALAPDDDPHSLHHTHRANGGAGRRKPRNTGRNTNQYWSESDGNGSDSENERRARRPRRTAKRAAIYADEDFLSFEEDAALNALDPEEAVDAYYNYAVQADVVLPRQGNATTSALEHAAAGLVDGLGGQPARRRRKPLVSSPAPTDVGMLAELAGRGGGPGGLQIKAQRQGPTNAELEAMAALAEMSPRTLKAQQAAQAGAFASNKHHHRSSHHTHHLSNGNGMGEIDDAYRPAAAARAEDPHGHFAHHHHHRRHRGRKPGTASAGAGTGVYRSLSYNAVYDRHRHHHSAGAAGGRSLSHRHNGVSTRYQHDHAYSGGEGNHGHLTNGNGNGNHHYRVGSGSAGGGMDGSLNGLSRSRSLEGLLAAQTMFGKLLGALGKATGDEREMPRVDPGAVMRLGEVGGGFGGSNGEMGRGRVSKWPNGMHSR